MKGFLVFGWFEHANGTTSRAGGMNDALRDPDGKIMSFGGRNEALDFLTNSTTLGINVAQIFDVTAGTYEEFVRKAWTLRQPNSGPQPPKAKPPTGGGNPPPKAP